MTEQAPPKMDHEHAVVNKKNRKVSYVNLTVNKKASSWNNEPVSCFTK